MALQGTDVGPMGRKGTMGAALAGWVVVLVCSMLIYDALLFSSLNREVWTGAQSSARMAADNVRLNVVTGVRFGKKLERYWGLDRVLDRVEKAVGMPLAVLDAEGRVLLSRGDFPPSAMRSGSVLEEGDGATWREDERGRTVFVAVQDRSGGTAGYIGAHVSRAPLEKELFSLFRGQLFVQAGIALCGLALLSAILILAGRRRAEAGGGLSRAVRLFGMGVFLLVMLANGLLAMDTVSSRYTESLRRDAERAGALLTDTLNRLLLVGVSFERMDRVDAYLSGIAATHGGTVALEIVSPQGRRVAGSMPEGTAVLPDAMDFPLLGGMNGMMRDMTEQGWKLQVSLLRAPWAERMRATAMDVLTMAAVSLIFMVELFLLFTRGLEFFQVRRRAGVAESGEERKSRSSLLRPLGFFMLFAMDMSISFIPLRMAELVPAGSVSRDMLLGMPISAEMGMTGLSVIVAGAWIKRFGARPPLMTGLFLVALGYLCSMLSTEPWHFVAARGVVGAGYGLALLTSQACTVKEGMLADMFAGVYAGSLCGSAMGAMLAERFGYAPVFLISAFILLCLAPLPRLLLRPGAEKEEKEGPKLTFAEMRRLLSDRRFLSFVLLSLVPSAMLCIGFLNYFLPVYLKSAGVSQSDIGRIYMLNCLLVIYSGPLFSRLVMKMRSMALMVCLAGIVSAASVLSLAAFAPLPATLLGSVLLGLATALNIPAQSEYLLQLDIARSIGVDQSMSLLDALQRVGQVLGPLCMGAALLAMSVDDAAKFIGAGFLVFSLAFLLLARPGRGKGAEDA